MLESPIIPILLMFGVMYVLMIRPQMQEKQAHDALIGSLAKDDRVVTASGIHGRVVEVAEHTVRLEVDSKSHITIDKVAVARRADGAGAKKAG